jgi:hypothetical protein
MVMAGEALEEVRRSLQRQGSQLKGAPWTLRGNPWNLDARTATNPDTLSSAIQTFGTGLGLARCLTRSL